MRRYAFSALLLLILPALVLVVMSQAPSADVSNDTGQPPDPASLNAVAAGTPVVFPGLNTITQTTQYTVTNLHAGPNQFDNQFYDGGYPAGTKAGEFSGSFSNLDEQADFRLDKLDDTRPWLNSFNGDIVVSATEKITVSSRLIQFTPTPGDTYLPNVHRDPTPTPTNTPTPTPTASAPVGTGIFHQISEDYGDDNSTAFWLYFWSPEGPGHPADGSIFVKVCISKGDHAGTCEWSANGHNGNTGELVMWLSYDDAWESKGTVTLYRSQDGTRPDEDADPISRGFIFDTRDEGSTVAMQFQECTTASTDWECDPDQWAARSSVDVIEGETLSSEAFYDWVDSLRQK